MGHTKWTEASLADGQSVDCLETRDILELPAALSSVGFWQAVCVHLMVKYHVEALALKGEDLGGLIQLQIAGLPKTNTVVLYNPIHRPDVNVLEFLAPAGRPL
ncbi:MAG: hypothetical protein FJW34_00155 [Acidobacteria bacterium]|nr:hypothetical protein [Acidobacteriota bacterium]